MKLCAADSHIHFHKCFDEGKFFDSCFQNLFNLLGNSFDNGILFFAQARNEDSFEYLRKHKVIKSAANKNTEYVLNESPDKFSLEVKWIEKKLKLLLIPGFQIVSKERLEILALGTANRCSDGLPIEETIRKVIETDAIPVLPWGFGKWYGSRGQIIKQLLNKNIPNLFLGDNGGRSKLLPYPSQFKIASQKNIQIIPGSDPLPFPDEIKRPLSYGFQFIADISNTNPWIDIKKILLDPNFTFYTFGKLTSPYKFIKTQAAIQLKKGD